MHPLNDTRSIELMDQLPGFMSFCIRKDHLCLSRSRDSHLHITIDIPVCMTGDRDRFLPCTDIRFDPLHRDRLAEHRPVHNRADRSIWTLIHLFQMILLHTGCIRRNRRALDRHSVFQCRLRRIDRHLIIGLIPVLKAQIIVLCLQVDIRKQELILDHLPKNPRHLIAVHLDKRRLHLNPAHAVSSSIHHLCCIRLPQPYCSSRQLALSFHTFFILPYPKTPEKHIQKAPGLVCRVLSARSSISDISDSGQGCPFLHAIIPPSPSALPCSEGGRTPERSPSVPVQST